MNNKLYRRNNITAAMIVVVLFTSTVLSIYRFTSMDFNVYDNKIRILVSEQRDEIEQGIYNNGKYPYIVFGLDGKVLYSDKTFNEKQGEYVNVQEMIQYDKSFETNNKGRFKESFVLQKNSKTNGFVVFLIPKKDVVKDSIYTRAWDVFYPSIFGIFISILIVVVRTVYCNKYILKPLLEISGSAKAIIRGNYDLEVVRVYEKVISDNEVGDLTFSFELMRDELKEKQLREEALKKSQQELISCISHDLKTPIATIKAYSEGLRDGIARTPKAQADYVSIIISKTDLLTDMINDLLEYSNVQLKQLDINREEVYLLDYLVPLMTEVSVFVKQKDLDFSYEIKTDDMIVNIDQKRITEVIYNLLENSIKYIGDKEGKIEIVVERQGKFVLIKVKDNGIGISADDIPYVFDKFYRAEKSRSSSIPGSGLGLSICKYIINEHGGEIYCKSSNSNGCEIGFTLQ